MSFDVDLRWLSAVFLVALRVGPLFVLAPVFGGADFPLRLRLLLGLAFAALLVAGGSGWPAAPLGPGGLLAAAVVEVLVGAAIAFGLMAAFGAFLLGGRLLDIQIGFGVASLFDPTTRAQSPLLGTGLNLMALAAFFALDGHHVVVRALADSLQRVPPGSDFGRLELMVLVEQFGAMFVHAVALVAPAVLALLLLDVALSVVARTMPQMNIFIVSMPLKVAVGLLMLVLSLPRLAPLLQRIFSSLPAHWQRLFS